jgi:protein-disulfide isomerase
MASVSRSLLIAFASALALAACNKPAGGGAAGVASSGDDMGLGPAGAKVTVAEYASASCPHCAAFNNETFQAFKKKYVDTGKVHYVFHEFLTPPVQFAAAGFLTARCAGKDKYFQVVDAIYHAQQDMVQSGEFHAGLLNIAKSAGMTDAQFEACITDEKALTALNARWDRYVKDDKIEGTPTYVINGKVYDKGEMTLADLDAAIAQAQGAGTPAS